jgi:prolyl-tRNA synthetase
VDVASYDELKAAVAKGKWARGGWAGSDEQEKQIKEETQASGCGVSPRTCRCW